MMASKIRVLDELTINQIAAGEVIENPASVVKELVENAIDASSDEIRIEVVGSGHQLIKVQDNGRGMTQEDALLSLQRHATSKLVAFSDIYSLSTLGFRGEALASIAAVSELTMITSPEITDFKSDSTPVLQNATFIQIEGGVVRSCSATQGLCGTTIEVRSLFYNTPARKKFQKSPARDAQDIVKTIEKIAFAFPRISFKLIVNGKQELYVEKKDENALYKRVESILGKEMISHMKPVHRALQGMTVTGFVHDETLSFSNRTKQYLFVNNRPVQSIAISAAIKNGYGPLLETNRHPAFVLFFTFADGAIDVNVHPQKKEVRFRDEELVIKTATSCVTNALLPQASSFDNKNQNSFIWQATPMPLPEFQPHMIENEFETEIGHQPDLPQEGTVYGSVFRCIGAFREFGLLEMQGQKDLLDQVAASFRESGILFIHIRRAMSRIAYEQLLYNEEGKSRVVESQHLLIPIKLDASFQEIEQILTMIPSLENLGFSIREFGSSSFLIEAIPATFSHLEVDEVKDFMFKIAVNDNEVKTHEHKARHLAAVATNCYRPPNPLSIEFVKMMVSKLLTCRTPFVCPFGKQIFMQVTESEILKRYV